MLGIDELGLARAVFEEFGVEEIKPLQRRAGLDECRQFQQRF